MTGADGEVARRRHAPASPKTGSEQQGAQAWGLRSGVWARRHRGRGKPLMTQSPVQIASDHRAEFARCLEPLLLLGPRRAVSTVGVANT